MVILVLTIFFSTLFMILGIVSFTEGGSGHSGSESNPISGTYWAYIGETVDMYSDYGGYYEVRFTTGSSGDYIIKLNDARIVEFNDDYGNNVSYYWESDWDYDNAYKANLSYYTTYVVTVYIEYYDANIFVDYYNNGADTSGNDISGTYWATLGEPDDFNANYGSYYEIKFTGPAGYYDLKFNGAYIVSVTNPYGSSVSYYSEGDWNDENTYYMYADSYDTYTIKICADSTDVTYYVDCD